MIESYAYARAGLLGNPSDGYFGKTISIIVKNFATKVSLFQSSEIKIEPNESDLNVFRDIDDFVETVSLTGYYGGVRLIKAAIKTFYTFCKGRRIRLSRENFTIRYQTSIPRQVGLGGSSAIIVATLRTLMKFYEVEIRMPDMANMALSAEKDQLGIQAGLQDRVIQVYEGCVYMDFNEKYMMAKKHGIYEPIEPSLLPNLYVAYKTDLGEVSGYVHENMRSMYEKGDKVVVETMERIGELTKEGRQALIRRDYQKLNLLIDENFDLRCRVMRISEDNREFVNMARECGATAKFAGSGGAIIGMYSDDKMFKNLSAALEKNHALVIKPIVV